MFGFPQYSRPANFHFNKNFLRSVTIQVKFPKNDVITSQKETWIKVLSAKFPNVQELQTGAIEIKNINNKTQFSQKDLGLSGFLFQTKDGLKSINISESFIVINTDGNQYTNIEGLWNDVEKEISEILGSCGIKELEWISIRKINVIQFELKEDSNALKGISAVFNHALVSNFLSIPGNDYLNSGISNVALKNKTQNLNLTLGLVPSQDMAKNLLLDIDLFFNDAAYPVEDIKKNLFQINQEIFNIFNWCLQDKTLEQLKK